MRRSVLVSSVLMVLSGAAFAEAPEAQSGPPPAEAAPAQPPPPPPAVPPAPTGDAVSTPPSSTAPSPAAVQGSAEATPTEPPPPGGGQWVHTGQFGWVWIPYSSQYTFIPADPQVYPSQFVYYPVYGWRWVVAPWVYGWGPRPYWGVWGPRYYSWYAHPWFRVGGYMGWGGYRGWGRYGGWIGPRSWGGRGWAGAPAYYRTGAGSFHQAAPVASGFAHRGPRGPGPGFHQGGLHPGGGVRFHGGGRHHH